MRRADGESRPKEKGETAALSALSSYVGQVQQPLKAASRSAQSSAAGQAALRAAWHSHDIPVCTGTASMV